MRAVLVFLMAASLAAAQADAGGSNYKEAALKAARWIRASAVTAAQGASWPADPRDPKTVNTSLYSGTPGVVLFFLEAHRSTGDESYLKDARAGADYLLASVAGEKEAGLYTGLAGIGFALQETFKLTGDRKYRDGAALAARAIEGRAIKSGAGVEWNSTTDIISGSAGTGLFLLYAAKELKEPRLRELAAQSGRRLIELGKPEAGGLKWAMTEKFPRLMPNFSHGTAGVAYFLATLYAETKGKEFLDAALAGASYLKAIAKTENDACLIFHNEPDGKQLYYLSWCHGPAGSARLFYRLYQVTGDREWMGWVRRSARAILISGIPDKQTPGFWNNVSQCCGSAGVADFFLSLYRVTRDRQYLSFAKRMTDQLLAKATVDAGGMYWVQAEHRVRPELLVAQTGLMQGAAGIGLWLLKLDGFERGKHSAITLPDSPF
jgi:lantibiotic modifying enzyme